MLKLNPGEVGLAIDNHAAFVIEGDMWRVVSAGGRVTRKIFVSRHQWFGSSFSRIRHVPASSAEQTHAELRLFFLVGIGVPPVPWPKI